MLYLILQLFWNVSGLHNHYARFLLMIGQWAVKSLRHFVWSPAIHITNLSGMYSHLILLLAIFLVSIRIPVARRIRVFLPIALLAVGIDVFTAVLTVQLQIVNETYRQSQVLLLIPAEFNLVESIWYLVYVVPLQAGPFLLLGVSALLNGVPNAVFATAAQKSTITLGTPSPRVIVACLAPIVVFISAACIWVRIRERNPQHMRAHEVLGSLLFERGDFSSARREYRIAIRSGSADGATWYRLALIEELNGNEEAARMLLEQGIDVVDEPAWQQWMMKAHRKWTTAS
jgi:hypothetical protein